MISYEDFGKLRLSQFVEPKKISPLANWEFMECLWLGEAVAFSEWLRLKDQPSVLRSLALDFTGLPESTVTRVLEQLCLPLRRGMTKSELVALLGEPQETLGFTPDRKTFKFISGGPESYWLFCTVLDQGGLTYLLVMVPIQDSWKYA
jgi:hypothetical protein